MSRGRQGGFTLIELSIVLVIIGLIVGGVLTGQSLIAAAAVRAQITQIEKFNTAAATFQGKYGYLPGDIPPPLTIQFGFISRAGSAGRGDGNGIIQGYVYNLSETGNTVLGGETAFVWEDLSAAGLTNDGLFTKAQDAANADYNITVPALWAYVPFAKIGNQTSIYIIDNNGQNYFVIAALYSIDGNGTIYGLPNGSPGLTVSQSSTIDANIDDGLPQSGRITAQYVNQNVCPYGAVCWASGGNVQGATSTAATPGSSTTCYDNRNVAGAMQQYSVEENNGAGVNCALSFQMQAGD